MPTKEKKVRCVDCQKWEGTECDFDEMCGSFDPQEYVLVNEMPFYEEK